MTTTLIITVMMGIMMTMVTTITNQLPPNKIILIIKSLQKKISNIIFQIDTYPTIFSSPGSVLDSQLID
jgi:hypothetical protein